MPCGLPGRGAGLPRWACCLLRLTPRCLEQMARDGLQLQQLFAEVSLSKEERDVVLRAVAKAEPTVSPPQQPPPQINTSALLKDVYTKVSPGPGPGS